MLPRAEADYLFGLMSSTNAEPSPSPKSLPPIGFAARLTKLDWKKDKKRILLIAGGALLAVVMAVLIPGSGEANASGYRESQMKSNPIQALASMAAKMRPDLEVASVDGARQTVTLKDKNGALSTFKFDPQTNTLVPAPAVQPKVAENPQPAPSEQPASALPGWMPVYPDTIPEIVSSSTSAEGDKETIATFKSGDKPAEIV